MVEILNDEETPLFLSFSYFPSISPLSLYVPFLLLVVWLSTRIVDLSVPSLRHQRSSMFRHIQVNIHLVRFFLFLAFLQLSVPLPCRVARLPVTLALPSAHEPVLLVIRPFLRLPFESCLPVAIVAATPGLCVPPIFYFRCRARRCIRA